MRLSLGELVALSTAIAFYVVSMVLLLVQLLS